MISWATQGCVLTPTLLSLMFAVLLIDAHREKGSEINAHRTDDLLHNIRRMKTLARVSTSPVYDLMLVDDCSLTTMTEANTHDAWVFLSPAAPTFAYPKHEETRIIHHSAAADEHTSGIEIAYLGDIKANNNKIDEEAASWISEAGQAFGRLQTSISNCYDFLIGIERKMWRVVGLLIKANSQIRSPEVSIRTDQQPQKPTVFMDFSMTTYILHMDMSRPMQYQHSNFTRRLRYLLHPPNTQTPPPPPPPPPPSTPKNTGENTGEALRPTTTTTTLVPAPVMWS
ncbi:hypothetical protein SprV_0702376600 [Sparganum proliferum]